MPHTYEVEVFEDYFWRRLGFPIHLFLRDLLELLVVSLCNLHPNTILHISIFIHFYEAYLRKKVWHCFKKSTLDPTVTTQPLEV